MYELCHGTFDMGICGFAREIGEVYRNPSLDLRYSCDHGEEPLTAFFERNGSSRGHHDVVAVRQITWIGQLHLTDLRHERKYSVCSLSDGPAVFCHKVEWSRRRGPARPME